MEDRSNFSIQDQESCHGINQIICLGGQLNSGQGSITSNSINELNTLLKEDATWIQMKQRMKEERHSVAALIIPEELSTCVRPIN